MSPDVSVGAVCVSYLRRRLLRDRGCLWLSLEIQLRIYLAGQFLQERPANHRNFMQFHWGELARHPEIIEGFGQFMKHCRDDLFWLAGLPQSSPLIENQQRNRQMIQRTRRRESFGYFRPGGSEELGMPWRPPVNFREI